MVNKCLRCGKCCNFYADGEWRKCRYLKQLKDGTYLCSVFPNRFKKPIYRTKDGLLVICKWRDDVPLNYEDCPYNKEGQRLADENSYNVKTY